MILEKLSRIKGKQLGEAVAGGKWPLYLIAQLVVLKTGNRKGEMYSVLRLFYRRVGVGATSADG